MILLILSLNNIPTVNFTIFNSQNPDNMNFQVIQDEKGRETGVFIPIKFWKLIKALYPNIENTEEIVETWEKELIDSRLQDISNNPKSLKDGTSLFEKLNHKI